MELNKLPSKKIAWLLLLAIAVGSAVLLVKEANRYYQNSQYNRKIAQGEYLQAQHYGAAHGEFAHAYALHQQGDYQKALMAYVQLEQTDNPVLKKAVMFNAGNAYLELALQLDVEKDAEKVFPLAELAKESYRRVLRLDSSYLPAKYNLERALQLVPDAQDQEMITQEGFARLVRTIISSSQKDELP